LETTDHKLIFGCACLRRTIYATDGIMQTI